MAAARSGAAIAVVVGGVEHADIIADHVGWAVELVCTIDAQFSLTAALTRKALRIGAAMEGVAAGIVSGLTLFGVRSRDFGSSSGLWRAFAPPDYLRTYP